MLLRSLREEGETALSYHYLARAIADTQGKQADVLAAQARALKFAPGNPVFLAAFGLRLVDAGRDQEALAVLSETLARDPQNVLALPWVLRLKRRYLQWGDQQEEDAALATLLDGDFVIDPLMLLTFVDDPAVQLRFSRLSAPKVTAQPLPPHAPHDKIRIGYFSADFREHATMHLMEGVFKAHDRAGFEFYVYDFTPDPRCRQHQIIRDFADVYQDVSALSPIQTAELARRDQLDIVVDLKGRTTDSRPMIFARRVAPVQVSFLGFPGTTAMAEMDYMIADNITIPAGDEQYYSEQILRMPGCYQPTNNARVVPTGAHPRSKFGLPEDKFIFANFNHPHKVGPSEFATWMEILRQVPNSVLLFYAGKNDLSAELASRAEAHGINAARILPCGSLSQQEHLERIAQVDLCLDCFAYNAHTTASDALWAGVPLLTLCGRQFAARVATSIMSAAGVPELSTDSKEAYVAAAVRIATDKGELQALKRQIKECRHASTLFDTNTWTRNYEALLTKCHARVLAGEAPAHMSLGEGAA
ncbi:UDP-N-acetylglucosamine-peptide N-acetylglucosaminyltransferase [Rhodobacteraceae bacterium G21628-S1]|nr:UDP-N-acetylglucosamine-peptide N-acetylglucosaminyltransferase [Rhodobacteraceae bacterium G21628-S1]